MGKQRGRQPTGDRVGRSTPEPADGADAYPRGETGSGGRRGAAVPAGFGYALGCQAMVHGHRGQFDEAYRCLDEALDAIKRSGHAVEGSLLGARALTEMWQSNSASTRDRPTTMEVR